MTSQEQAQRDLEVQRRLADAWGDEIEAQDPYLNVVPDVGEQTDPLVQGRDILFGDAIRCKEDPSLSWDCTTAVAGVLPWGRISKVLKGKWLTRLFRNGDDAVDTLGRVSRVWTSADTHVGEIATAIDKTIPGSVRGVNVDVKMLNGRFREADVLLDGVIVQVKGEKAVGLTGQVQKTLATTGIPTVGYAPDIPTAAWINAAREGVPIARDPDELMRLIAEVTE